MKIYPKDPFKTVEASIISGKRKVVGIKGKELKFRRLRA